MARRKLKKAMQDYSYKEPMKPMAYENPTPEQKAKHETQMETYRADMAEYERLKVEDRRQRNKYGIGPAKPKQGMRAARVSPAGTGMSAGRRY